MTHEVGPWLWLEDLGPGDAFNLTMFQGAGRPDGGWTIGGG